MLLIEYLLNYIKFIMQNKGKNNIHFLSKRTILMTGNN